MFGPRQTGKSSYVREELKGEISLGFNLLERGLSLRLLADPTLIRQEIEQRQLRNALVCIDEIQKLPELLDEVQWLIEERGIRFLLTGSSARKLRRQGTNLLGGRARDRGLHPLVSAEIGLESFDLLRALNHGLLPFHYLSQDPTEDLHAYVGRYLSEEIAAEGVSRNIPAFSRFLQVAAQSNGQLINYTTLGRDAQVARQTVQQWFQVLQETLLGFQLEPFTRTSKRKAIETSKFYFFDTGVVRALRNLPPIAPQSREFGDFFEQFIFMELRAWVDYCAPRTPLGFWRSTSKFEVDFVLGEQVAIEVKVSSRISAEQMKGLKAL